MLNFQSKSIAHCTTACLIIFVYTSLALPQVSNPRPGTQTIAGVPRPLSLPNPQDQIKCDNLSSWIPGGPEGSIYCQTAEDFLYACKMRAGFGAFTGYNCRPREDPKDLESSINSKDKHWKASVPCIAYEVIRKSNGQKFMNCLVAGDYPHICDEPSQTLNGGTQCELVQGYQWNLQRIV
ncbi:hypothetical protein CROQUDRAFT_96076 [Cronartium quercuum f. sp. fusiforme G11]|uniref:Secreted protein n=1 Tax=Cronartium quercuum f. sp. fusiforme G11 TaxID=708437 RepID=A0A9P6NCG9_9BASI|nr:hypothetical protein CROQUDRAFT_96076 [Cronartium quercuum f. sp. fusiforme G11]